VLLRSISRGLVFSIYLLHNAASHTLSVTICWVLYKSMIFINLYGYKLGVAEA